MDVKRDRIEDYYYQRRVRVRDVFCIYVLE